MPAPSAKCPQDFEGLPSTDGDSRAKATASTLVHQEDSDGQDNHKKYDVRKIELHRAFL
jgi:hypothetical protein